YRHTGNGFWDSLVQSEWIGLDNFKFLFQSSDAYIITRNTILYNLGFIVLGLIFAVGIAIIFSEMRSKKLVKIYQTTTLFPYFLSWVIISFFVYAFLSPDKGLINNILKGMGMDPINWYSTPTYWPFILLFLGIWKGLGYNSIIYYATIMGIDPTYYEAAIVDGATKWQRIRYVTLPQLMPLMTILT
ncbi:ABC transporter permease subunit, partial [Streptococcus suis]